MAPKFWTKYRQEILTQRHHQPELDRLFALFIFIAVADPFPGAAQFTLICRKAGISQATYVNWKKRYDGLLPTEMRRIKQLEDENGKLRKVVADLSLDKEMLQDALRGKL
jgi:putative transposase